MNSGTAATKFADTPGVPAAPDPALKDKVRAFTLDWITHRLGSPREFIMELEEAFGWHARHVIVEAIETLRKHRDLQDSQRDFLNHNLSEPAVLTALDGEPNPANRFQSCLDELFARSQRFRDSKHFAEAVEFIAKFREYSPYNNMLVYLQNPYATHFATSRHWFKAFGRTVKNEARGLIILAPKTPVLLVYDIADTDGPKLPKKMELFAKTKGNFHPTVLDHSLKNCGHEGILVERRTMGPLRGGLSTRRTHTQEFPVHIALRQDLDEPAAYLVLCHELAHVYLGHLGGCRELGWPYRQALSNPIAEIEAEAVAYIVCRRAGLKTHSAEYLSSFVGDGENLGSISLDLISRTVARIEEMGRKLNPQRKHHP